jgi:hypothetical protein
LTESFEGVFADEYVDAAVVVAIAVEDKKVPAGDLPATCDSEEEVEEKMSHEVDICCSVGLIAAVAVLLLPSPNDFLFPNNKDRRDGVVEFEVQF